MGHVKHTDEQQAIIADGASRRPGNILIKALAGCAKTTTLIEVIKVMPQRSVLFAAFNRGIADTAEARMPRMPPTRAVVIQTLHAIGRRVVLKHYPHLQIDKTATETLVHDACAVIFPGAPYEVRSSAVRLVRCAKETLSPDLAMTLNARNQPMWIGWSDQTLLELGFEQNIFSPKLSYTQIERCIGVVHDAIARGIDVQRRTSIDFCDMTWLPLVLRLAPPSRYQAIIVDEVQDASAPQVELLMRLALPNTRFVVAGDDFQQLYAWRGSLGSAAWTHFAGPGYKSYPLTMTWRCSKAVVCVANELVPGLRAQPNATQGSVTTCTLGELPYTIAQGRSDAVHTFILSRNNATLLDVALFLWRSGIKFRLNAGQNILEPLFVVIDRELDATDDQTFRKSLFVWHKREADRADKIGSTSRREQIDEQRAMLLAALRYAAPNRLKKLLISLLADDKRGVLLSTVHKVKGLEADRVFLLKQTFGRHATRRRETPDGGVVEVPLPNPSQEELNVEYVGITRAREDLVWVDLTDRERPELLETPIAEIPHAELEGALVLAERAMLAAEDAGDLETADATGKRVDALLKRIRS